MTKSKSPITMGVVLPVAAPIRIWVAPTTALVVPGKYVFTIPVIVPLPSWPGFAQIALVSIGPEKNKAIADIRQRIFLMPEPRTMRSIKL